MSRRGIISNADPLMRGDVAWRAFFDDLIEGKITRLVLSYQMQNEDDYLFLRWLLLQRILPAMPGDWPKTIERLNAWYDEVVAPRYECDLHGEIGMLKNSIRSESVMLMNRYPEPMKGTSSAIGASLFVLCTHTGVEYSASSLRIALLLVKLYGRVFASHKEALVSLSPEEALQKQLKAQQTLNGLIPNGVDGLSEALYNYVKSMSFQRGLLAAMIFATYISFGGVYSSDSIYSVGKGGVLYSDRATAVLKHQSYVKFTEDCLEAAFKVVNPSVAERLRAYGLLEPYTNSIDMIDVFADQEDGQGTVPEHCEDKSVTEHADDSNAANKRRNSNNNYKQKNEIKTPEAVRLELLHNWRLKMFINIIGDSSITVVWTALFAANTPAATFLSGVNLDKNDEELPCLTCYGVKFCCCGSCVKHDTGKKIEYPCGTVEKDFKSTFWAAVLSYLIGDILHNANSIETLRVILQTDLIQRTNSLTREEILTILGGVSRKTATTFTIVYPLQGGSGYLERQMPSKKSSVDLQVYNARATSFLKLGDIKSIAEDPAEAAADTKTENPNVENTDNSDTQLSKTPISCTLAQSSPKATNQTTIDNQKDNIDTSNVNIKSTEINASEQTPIRDTQQQAQYSQPLPQQTNVQLSNRRYSTIKLTKKEVNTMNGKVKLTKHDMLQRLLAMRKFHTLLGARLSELVQSLQINLTSIVALSKDNESHEKKEDNTRSNIVGESENAADNSEGGNAGSATVLLSNRKTEPEKLFEKMSEIVEREIGIEQLAKKDEEKNALIPTTTNYGPGSNMDDTQKSKIEDAVKQLSSDIYDLRQIKDIFFNILPSNETLMNELDENENYINMPRYKTSLIDGVPTKKMMTNDNFVAAINEFTQLYESMEIKRKKILELEKLMTDLTNGINRFGQ